MHYRQAVFPVSAHEADALSDALMAHGALSAAIEDAAAGTEAEEPIFGEPGMPEERLWAKSTVIALFAEDADVAGILAAAAADTGVPVPEYLSEEVPEQDWVRLTQSQFDPIRISERLWITPSWHRLPEKEGVVNLQLDPGLAFGTGSHPTTKLCLQWLDRHLSAEDETRVLDYGCGSGILTIAALKLGAAEACGVDIDPQALRASRANAENNVVPARFFLPDELPEGTFDLVLANILANPLRLLGDMLAARTAPGGRIVLSGILSEQLEELSALYGRWFDLFEPETDQGWVCISGRRLG